MEEYAYYKIMKLSVVVVILIWIGHGYYSVISLLDDDDDGGGGYYKLYSCDCLCSLSTCRKNIYMLTSSPKL